MNVLCIWSDSLDLKKIWQCVNSWMTHNILSMQAFKSLTMPFVLHFWILESMVVVLVLKFPRRVVWKGILMINTLVKIIQMIACSIHWNASWKILFNIRFLCRKHCFAIRMCQNLSSHKMWILKLGWHRFWQLELSLTRSVFDNRKEPKQKWKQLNLSETSTHQLHKAHFTVDYKK